MGDSKTGCHWLLVTNPALWDSDSIFTASTTDWGGDFIKAPVMHKRIREKVRNGDQALIYLTSPEKAVVGIVKVVSDPVERNGKPIFLVSPVRRFDNPVSLSRLKTERTTARMEFILNSRVSVAALTGDEYSAIIQLAENVITEPVGVDDLQPADPDHIEVQRQLAEIGGCLGCKVWIAPDSRQRVCSSTDLSTYCIDELPALGLDQETTSLVRSIDVLWLAGNKIEAAFEVEHTTSIYSGLLRMADLLALQPNVTIKLFIVAPASRGEQVRRQVNRPTFARLPQPMTKLVRFISYPALGKLLEMARMLGPDLKISVVSSQAERLDQAGS